MLAAAAASVPAAISLLPCPGMRQLIPRLNRWVRWPVAAVMAGPAAVLGAFVCGHAMRQGLVKGQYAITLHRGPVPSWWLYDVDLWTAVFAWYGAAAGVLLMFVAALDDRDQHRIKSFFSGLADRWTAPGRGPSSSGQAPETRSSLPGLFPGRRDGE